MTENAKKVAIVRTIAKLSTILEKEAEQMLTTKIGKHDTLNKTSHEGVIAGKVQHTFFNQYKINNINYRNSNKTHNSHQQSPPNNLWDNKTSAYNNSN
jgi:hypothetical protein